VSRGRQTLEGEINCLIRVIGLFHPFGGPKYGVKGSKPASNRLTMTIATEVDERSAYQGAKAQQRPRLIAEAYRIRHRVAPRNSQFWFRSGECGVVGAIVYLFALCQVAKVRRMRSLTSLCAFLDFCARVSSQGPVCPDRRNGRTDYYQVERGSLLQLNQCQRNNRFQPRGLSVQPPVRKTLGDRSKVGLL
jgi:hypothetical protein